MPFRGLYTTQEALECVSAELGIEIKRGTWDTWANVYRDVFTPEAGSRNRYYSPETLTRIAAWIRQYRNARGVISAPKARTTDRFTTTEARAYVSAALVKAGYAPVPSATWYHWSEAYPEVFVYEGVGARKRYYTQATLDAITAWIVRRR